MSDTAYQPKLTPAMISAISSEIRARSPNHSAVSYCYAKLRKALAVTSVRDVPQERFAEAVQKMVEITNARRAISGLPPIPVDSFDTAKILEEAAAPVAPVQSAPVAPARPVIPAAAKFAGNLDRVLLKEEIDRLRAENDAMRRMLRRFAALKEDLTEISDYLSGAIAVMDA